MFSISFGSPYLCLSLRLSLFGQPRSPTKSRGYSRRPAPRGGGGAAAAPRGSGGRDGESLPGQSAGARRWERPPQDFSDLEWVQGSSWLQKPFPSLASGFVADKWAHAGPPSTLHTRGCRLGVSGGVCVSSSTQPPHVSQLTRAELLYSLYMYLRAFLRLSAGAAGVQGNIALHTRVCK